jgi:S1-C subfamily serine protease
MVIRKIRKLRGGTRVKFEVVRGKGERREITVVLGEKPSSGR